MGLKLQWTTSQVVIHVTFQNAEREAVSLWPASVGASAADSKGHLRCGVRACGPQSVFPPGLRDGLCQLAPGDKAARKGPGSLSEEPPSPPSERAALRPGGESGAVGSRRAGAPWLPCVAESRQRLLQAVLWSSGHVALAGLRTAMTRGLQSSAIGVVRSLLLMHFVLCSRKSPASGAHTVSVQGPPSGEGRKQTMSCFRLQLATVSLDGNLQLFGAGH